MLVLEELAVGNEIAGVSDDEHVSDVSVTGRWFHEIKCGLVEKILT
jgi:hypothetical protein